MSLKVESTMMRQVIAAVTFSQLLLLCVIAPAEAKWSIAHVIERIALKIAESHFHNVSSAMAVNYLQRTACPDPEFRRKFVDNEVAGMFLTSADKIDPLVVSALGCENIKTEYLSSTPVNQSPASQTPQNITPARKKCHIFNGEQECD